MALKDDNTMVNIGRLTSAVGLKGEIKVLTYAEDSENLHEGTVLYMEKGGTITTAEVTGIRFQKNRPVIRLENVTDRNGAAEYGDLHFRRGFGGTSGGEILHPGFDRM